MSSPLRQSGDLFDAAPLDLRHEALAPGAQVLRGWARQAAPALVAAIEGIVAAAPLRHLVTPSGFRMSVAMTNCGSVGWVSDRRGYRYEGCDPQSGKRWPAMPAEFLHVARSAAAAAGFAGFEPDACLINRYVPGARLTLHQDKDEKRLNAPIVSVSLGLPTTFLFGGDARTDKQRKVPLQHGDVVVWGGPARLHYHGVLALRDGEHPTLGAQRLNLTFRRAG